MSTQSRTGRRLLFTALAIVAATAWISPFRRDLFVGDETKYGQVVREMRATGAFFLPTLEGVPFAHKPPLHFWLIDGLTLVFGVYSMWSFVLPALVALLFLMWLLWRMGGPVAAFVGGSSLMIWGSAQSARMDVGFTALTVVGAWMMLRAFERDAAGGGDGRQTEILVSGMAFGFATLLKGPMAPVIAIVLYAIESWRRGRRPRAVDAGALGIMAAIPLAWFVPAMIIGGAAYTRNVIMKQTVGRAVSAWVHKAPPWFYLEHMPLDLLPWFFPALFAVRRANRFYVSWILAVLVPYSLVSSKLDVYMMALIPPVALMIADRVEAGPSAGTRIGNALALLSLMALGIAGLLVSPAQIHVPEAALLNLTAMKIFFLIFAAGAAIGILATFRSPLASTVAAGMVPIVAMTWLVAAMMPAINELASTRRLIAALEAQHVAPERIALFSCPYLWSRDFPRELERVRYVDPEDVGDPLLIATSRAHAAEIETALRGYHPVQSVRMIGKWFDVHRR